MSLKGKEKAIVVEDENENEESSDSAADSGSDSDSSSTSSTSSSSSKNQHGSDDEIELLVQKALAKQAALKSQTTTIPHQTEGGEEEEEHILLEKDKKDLPKLDPGKLPEPYFALGSSKFDPPKKLRDPDIEAALKAAAKLSAPAPPIRPPQLTSKSGKPLTKKEMKAMRNTTAGADWFDLPAPPESELPRLHREVEALRLRRQLDPKRFYKKDEGEGKGIKGLPKHFAIGTIVATDTPFGAPSSENLTRAERKRTLVDELVEDAEARRYAKKKFEELQKTKGARGRNTLHAKNALKRRKF